MKSILYFCLIFILLFSLGNYSFAQKRAARFEAEFQKTLALVNSDRFMIKFFMATPMAQTFVATPLGGPNVAINPNQSYLWIMDSLVDCRLPYFGNGYWVPKAGQDSILLHHILFSRTVKTYQNRNKKAIAYQISILTPDNIYFLHLDIQYDGSCYLYLSDKKRYPISYTGNILPLEKNTPLPTSSPGKKWGER